MSACTLLIPVIAMMYYPLNIGPTGESVIVTLSCEQIEAYEDDPIEPVKYGISHIGEIAEVETIPPGNSYVQYPSNEEDER